MPRIPESPEDIFARFTEDVQAAFGEELVSIALFGSGARGEYVPEKSDINFIVVLTQKGMDRLNAALDLVAKWRKVKVAVPLFLTQEYIDSALDTFPIEFLGMHKFHKNVFGKDCLSGLEIESNDLRRQIERELRGKLIYLRTGFLSAGGNRGRLQEMLAASVAAFNAIFEGLLYLKGQDLPETRLKVFEKAAELFNLDKSVFAQLTLIKKGEWHGSQVQLQEIAMSYIFQIKKMVELVNKI